MGGRDAIPTCLALSSTARLSQDQTRVLQLLQAEVAQAWESTLASLLSSQVSVSPSPPGLCPDTADWAKVLFNVSPYGFTGQLRFESGLAYALLEIGLGGNLSNPPARPLNNLEISLLTKIVEPLIRIYQNHWRKLAEVTFSGDGHTSAGSNREGIQWPLTISLADHSWQVTVWLPLPEATYLLDCLTLPNWIAGGGQRPVEGPAVMEALQSSRVSVQAILGSISLTAGEIERLDRGSVILLPGLSEDLVAVHIADRPKFTGKVRHIRGSLVVELSSSLSAQETPLR